MVCVAVEDHVHWVAAERLFQSAGTEIRIDLEGFTSDGGRNWRVVQQCHAPLGAELPQRGLELQCFIQGLAHELLDQCFAPGSERPSTKSPGKSLDPRKTDPEHLSRLAIEDVHARVAEDLGYLALLARLIIVIAQHG